MESLVANYASSDEEDDRDQQSQSKTDAASKASSFFSSLPQPKTSSLFSSLPQSKQRQSTHVNKTPIQSSVIIEEDKASKKPSLNSNKSSSILSSLPLPKSKTLDQPHPTSDVTAKRVVQFKPPSIYSSKLIDQDEDEDDEEKERLKRKQSEYQNQNSSVKSFLSSIPAPKKSSSLGVLPSASGSGRRSIIENEVPASSSSGLGANSVSGKSQYVADDGAHEFGRDQRRVDNANYESITDPSMVNYEVGSDQNAATYVDYSSYGYGLDPNINSGDGSSYVNYEDHNGYGDYYSASRVQGTPGIAQSWVGMPGKKRKNDIPTEIVEVNQDELMKNRPTEDKAKLTGIAFGPSYAPVSAKGKPSKLLKRKHQISSLYFDMKQKEMELAERRAKGFLTKAQTQGKYGW